jgi:hypothetical protein
MAMTRDRVLPTPGLWHMRERFYWSESATIGNVPGVYAALPKGHIDRVVSSTVYIDIIVLFLPVFGRYLATN